MRNERGFTLIELLVVIAIIALLMAILMPSLQRVRKQGQAVTCLSNLKHWGLVWYMYTEQNEALFPERIGMWQDVVQPYYKDETICLCPVAKRLYSQGGETPFGAWEMPGAGGKDVVGSYGLNQWLIDHQGTNTVGRREPKLLWRTPNVAGTNQIPVFLDCVVTGATVWPEDTPPEFDGHYWSWGTGGSRDEMRRFCINRHGGFTNGLFMDWSATKIGLKQLWTFKWHREFNTANIWTTAGGALSEDWPQWLRGFKNY